MASNFPFSPYGLSQRVTVGGAAAATVSFSIVNLGGTTATVAGSARLQPGSVRIANNGTASVFLQFGAAPAATVTVSTGSGLEMLSNSVEVFSVRGYQFMAAICASTFTVTLCMSLGEGL